MQRDILSISELNQYRQNYIASYLVREVGNEMICKKMF